MNKAALQLCVASVLWGFGFIGIVWSLQAYTPLATMSLRFTAVSLVCVPAWLFSKSFRRDFNWSLLKISFWPAFFLASTLFFQTWGLKYTSATNSGFLTTLYVLFTAFTESLFNKKLPSSRLIIAIAIAMIGTALICRVHEMTSMNKGDFLTIICAWAAVGQFMTLSHISPKLKVSAFAFNLSQSLWIALICDILLLLCEPFPKIIWDFHQAPFWGIFSLAFGASLIAFFLQVKAQKKLKASTASLICLLESPFAALFAILLLNEHFDFLQSSGALLIFYAAILAVKEEKSTA